LLHLVGSSILLYIVRRHSLLHQLNSDHILILCSSKVHSIIVLLSRCGSEVIYFLQDFRQKYVSYLHSTAACMHRILNVNTLIQCFPATLPRNIDRRSATNYGINTQKIWHFLNIARKILNIPGKTRKTL